MDNLERVKKILDEKGVFYKEHTNGQLQVGTINFWVSSEKYYDTKQQCKGQGLNMFLNYLEDRGIIRAKKEKIEKKFFQFKAEEKVTSIVGVWAENEDEAKDMIMEGNYSDHDCRELDRELMDIKIDNEE